MLTPAFGIGLSGLKAFQKKTDTHAHNIANAATPDFKKQVLNLEEAPAQLQEGFWMGRGVQVGSVSRVIDELLEQRITAAKNNAGKGEGLSASLSALESAVGPAISDFSDSLQAFRSAINAANQDPDNLVLREAVLDAGKTVARSKNALEGKFTEVASNLTSQLGFQEDALNSKLSTLSDINKSLEREPNNPELVEKGRGIANEVIRLAGGSYYMEEGTGKVMVQAENGTVLKSPMDMRLATGGTIGGVVQSQQTLGTLQTFVSSTASELKTAFNLVHAGGTDLAGNAGGTFFAENGGQWSVGLADPKDLAMGQGGGPLDNRNGLALVGGLDAKSTQGGTATITESLAQATAKLGNAVNAAKDSGTAADNVLEGLLSQAQEKYGVNVDEELVGLMQAQRCYEACAKVIQTADAMLQTLLDIKR